MVHVDIIRSIKNKRAEHSHLRAFLHAAFSPPPLPFFFFFFLAPFSARISSMKLAFFRFDPAVEVRSVPRFAVTAPSSSSAAVAFGSLARFEANIAPRPSSSESSVSPDIAFCLSAF